MDKIKRQIRFIKSKPMLSEFDVKEIQQLNDRLYYERKRRRQDESKIS